MVMPDMVEHTGLTQNPDVQNMVLDFAQRRHSSSFPCCWRKHREGGERTLSQTEQSPDGDSDLPVPSYYVSVINAASIVVSDTHGNSTAPFLGDVLGTVPGVETFHMGDNAEEIALPVSASEDYNVTFNSTDQPIASRS